MATRADVLDTARTAGPVMGKAIAADFGRLLGLAFVLSLAVGLLLSAACPKTPRSRLPATPSASVWTASVIVQAHGGTIGVDSDLGRGSRLWFTVPLVGAGRALTPHSLSPHTLRTRPDPSAVETCSRPPQAGLEGQPPLVLSPGALPPAGQLVWRSSVGSIGQSFPADWD